MPRLAAPLIKHLGNAQGGCRLPSTLQIQDVRTHIAYSDGYNTVMRIFHTRNEMGIAMARGTRC